MEPILNVKNITKAFSGVRVLKNVSLTVNRGEIHCLVGENGCGKSTLVKCISGVYTPDEGEIILNGQRFTKLTTQQAIQNGVQVIYQDMSLFRHMSVAENIAVEKIRAKGARLINWKDVARIAAEQTRKINVRIDLEKEIFECPIAIRQLTAICRALAHDAKILVMDEPTTALTKNEVSQLLTIVQELKSQGMSIIFISHKLDEVFSVADVITVIRNGEKIGDYDRAEINEKRLSELMTGREIDYPRYRRDFTDNTPLLEVKRLSRKGHFYDISFALRKGDIVGLIGLLGSGRSEIAMSLFGLNPIDSGEIFVSGEKVSIAAPQDAKRRGIALLPEDRFREGLFTDLKIKENVSSTVIDEISPRGCLDFSEEDRLAEKCIETFKVRAPSRETVVQSLSGGNQQKIVIGKWVETKPNIFIMDSPTVGIDIGSKAEIYEQIHNFAKNGMAFLLISDEVEEILANCNRVFILEKGRIKTVLVAQDLRQPDAKNLILEEIGSRDLQPDTEPSTK